MLRRHLLIVTWLVAGVLLAGCAATGGRPPGPSATLPEGARNELGRIAVRGDYAVQLEVAGVVRGKGEGAASTAAGAVGGMFAEVSEPSEALVALLASPIVAVGGAVYGAAVADKAATVVDNLALLEARGSQYPQVLQRLIEAELAGVSFVDQSFVASDVDEDALRSAGHDSVIDVEIQHFTAVGSGPRTQMRFVLGGTVRVNPLDGNFVPAIRHFRVIGGQRTLSQWTAENGAALDAELHALGQRLAAQVADDLFRENAVMVVGDAPRRRGALGRVKVDDLTPYFGWHLQYRGQRFSTPQGVRAYGDGPLLLPDEARGAIYEFSLYDEANVLVQRSDNLAEPHLQLSKTLEGCERYEWQVRARYESIGRAVETVSPRYAFKTACERGR